MNVPIYYIALCDPTCENGGTCTVYVYIQQHGGYEGSIFICSKTEDDSSIFYVPRQGMRACNNNNMRNPIRKEM